MPETQPKWKIDKKNHINLAENEVLNKAKEGLTTIRENLSEKKITVDEAKREIEKIYEKIKWTNLEQQDKEFFWKPFEKLAKLERDIDETTLKNEVSETINLLETVVKKDLANLKNSITKPHEIWKNTRPIDVQKWIEQSSENLASTIDDASQDKNPIARKIGDRMKKLIS